MKHVKLLHPKKCPDLFSQTKKPTRGFFKKAKTKLPFDVDVFMPKLLKWIVQTDQPFFLSHYFKDMMEYFKQDISIKSLGTPIDGIIAMAKDYKLLVCLQREHSLQELI